MNNKQKNDDLIRGILTKSGLVFLLVGLILFLPAGSLKFINGWLLLFSLVFPAMIMFYYFYNTDKTLLKNRLKLREKEKQQKTFNILSLPVSLLTFLIPGLDFRYHWSSVPVEAVVIGIMTMIIGYYLFFRVMNENSFASRVIEIQDGHKLIDTGLYASVRHPMYLAGTIIYLSLPLVSGSWYAYIPTVMIPVLLIIRIKNEEKVLNSGLKGYGDYMKKVKCRMIPHIW